MQGENENIQSTPCSEPVTLCYLAFYIFLFTYKYLNENYTVSQIGGSISPHMESCHIMIDD